MDSGKSKANRREGVKAHHHRRHHHHASKQLHKKNAKKDKQREREEEEARIQRKSVEDDSSSSGTLFTTIKKLSSSSKKSQAKNLSAKRAQLKKKLQLINKCLECFKKQKGRVEQQLEDLDEGDVSDDDSN